MKQEHDEYLCKTYPKMFVNRHADMRTTAMCWGFECGDGWYNIIASLCANIQHHIDWKRKQRYDTLTFNRRLRKAIDQNSIDPLISHLTNPSQWMIDDAKENLANKKFRVVSEKVSQVVVDQVKEKFGTLRFYYHGGDDAVSGMVRMAESMSAVTCEECGNLGSQRHGGWIRTLCDTHEEERQLKYKERLDNEQA